MGTKYSKEPEDTASNLLKAKNPNWLQTLIVLSKGGLFSVPAIVLSRCFGIVLGEGFNVTINV